MVEKELPEEVYKLTPEEEALVLEGLADYKAGRMYSEEEVRDAIREARKTWSQKDPKTA
jgi:predicted transcriptional regulator